MTCDTRITSEVQNQLTPHHGDCPTCGQQTTFVYLGEQHWPPAVAQKLNMDPVVHLWRCERCQTTLTQSQGEFSSR